MCLHYTCMHKLPFFLVSGSRCQLYTGLTHSWHTLWVWASRTLHSNSVIKLCCQGLGMHSPGILSVAYYTTNFVGDEKCLHGKWNFSQSGQLHVGIEFSVLWLKSTIRSLLLLLIILNFPLFKSISSMSCSLNFMLLAHLSRQCRMTSLGWSCKYSGTRSL